ncbi:phosphate acetytransferase [Aeromonas sp. CU5]|uniref:phosphate acyltransferase n=1 Tax=Aeromonas sp. CU5 TaxID=2033033 RepID=UPI000BFE154D|nr:phosphate acyltransferase [Aeromonas sp. CU5]ATL91579.1 phosphate acetytransferase [Aeromonas sp. CU5]
MLLSSLESFVEIAKNKSKLRKLKIAVAAAEDETTLFALKMLSDQGIAEPILVGDRDIIVSLADKLGYDIDRYEVIHEKNKGEACKQAVALVKEGHADMLTRGSIGTPEYLRPILHRETGLKKAKIVSQAAFIQIATYHKVFAYTDSGINISPDVNEKAQMIQQCVDVFHSLGVSKPKVAVIAATEGVKTAMPSTIDAAILTQMNRRDSIKGCLVDGPLSIDLAFSSESVKHKGITTEVGGDVDLILLPDINSANVFYKTTTFLGGAKAASFIIGTIAPVDFPSRSDSVETKYYAIACALAQCNV